VTVVHLLITQVAPLDRCDGSGERRAGSFIAAFASIMSGFAAFIGGLDSNMEAFTSRDRSAALRDRSSLWFIHPVPVVSAAIDSFDCDAVSIIGSIADRVPAALSRERSTVSHMRRNALAVHEIR
jgi:hypothetical protein